MAGKENKRVRNRNFCFTINCHEEAESPRFYDPECIEWGADVRYVVAGLEKAPTTGQLHWQGYCEFHKAVGIKKAKELLQCSWAHLETRRGSQKQAIDYCRKQDTAVSDANEGSSQSAPDSQIAPGVSSQITPEPGQLEKIVFEYGEPGEDGVRGRASKNNNYKQILQASTYQESIELMRELEPADFVRYRDNIERALRREHMQKPPFIRDMSTFCRSAIAKSTLDNKAVVLTGKSGCGKTSYAKSHFKHPLVISHMDQLKDVNPCLHDGLIFDDMSFAHMPTESCIHLCDLENDRYVHCRHSMGFMPGGMHRIFTTNKPYRSLFNFGTEEQEKAIDRRVYLLHVNKMLYTIDE